MKYYLDTANISDIHRILNVFPIEGVTTNPSILANESTTLKRLKEIQTIIGTEKDLFVQVIAKTSEEMINQANQLLNEIGNQIVIKIPVSQEGLKTIKHFQHSNIQTLATAIFSSQQGMWAAKAGADYLAPYVNRIDNMSADGVGVAQELLRIIDNYQFETKVLAASFKNVNQIQQLSLSGCHGVTVSPNLLEASFTHEGTRRSLDEFENEWVNKFQILNF